MNVKMELMTVIVNMPSVLTQKDHTLVNAGQVTLEMGEIVQVLMVFHFSERCMELHCMSALDSESSSTCAPLARWFCNRWSRIQVLHALYFR